MMRWLPLGLWGRWRRLRWLYPYLFAHKPLCGRFRHEVVRFGPVYVCRSCSLLWGAALLVLTMGYWLLPDATTAMAALAVLLPVVAYGSWPSRYARQGRRKRDALRAGTGVCMGLVGVIALAGAPVVALVLTLTGLVMRRWFASMRIAQASDPCSGCPELGQHGVCSGFVDQARAARRFEADLEARLNQESVP